MAIAQPPAVEILIPVEYKRLFDDDWREAAVYGGRGSLKSHTVARMLLIRGRMAKKRIACFREYQNSIGDSSHQLLHDLINQYKLTDYHVTDKMIVNTVTGTDFLFKGLHHNEQSVKSTEGIDIAWVEEAQTVSENSLEVLTPTVRKPGSQIIYTYNRLKEDDPVHKRLVKEGRPNTLVLNVNYDVALKYGWLPEVLRIEMESDREYRPNLYKHKWLGEPNDTEGKIYTDWNIIDEIPHEAELVRRGLDFGFTTDPAAIVDLYYYNGGYIVSERLYRRGMKNNDLGNFLSNLERSNTTIMADSSEPKSIAEVSEYGVPIIGVQKKADKQAAKGTDYLNFSIGYVQQQKISITRSSKNLIDEYDNYYWATDAQGKTTGKPEGGKDHALDALRYAFDGQRPKPALDEVQEYNQVMSFTL